jgi:hypothetical protein
MQLFFPPPVFIVPLSSFFLLAPCFVSQNSSHIYINVKINVENDTEKSGKFLPA